MIDPSYEQLVTVLPLLGRTRAYWIEHAVLGLTREAAEKLDVISQLLFMIAEWLVHLGFVTDANIKWIIIALRMDMQHPTCAGRVEILTATFNVVIAERRYVGWRGQTTQVLLPDSACFWRDMLTEKTLVKLPDPPVTTIVLNLRALYQRIQQRLEKLNARHSVPSPPA